MATYIYKCSNCDGILNETDKWCHHCGGMITNNIINNSTANVVGIGKVEFVKYIDVRKINDKEMSILNMIINEINNSNLSIQKKSDDYTTLNYKDYDLARVYSNGSTQKIKILLTTKDKKIYIDNPIFNIQTNKKEVLWASLWDENNLDIYVSLIQNKINEIDK